jgi:hypothetical protein
MIIGRSQLSYDNTHIYATWTSKDSTKTYTVAVNIQSGAYTLSAFKHVRESSFSCKLVPIAELSRDEKNEAVAYGFEILFQTSKFAAFSKMIADRTKIVRQLKAEGKAAYASTAENYANVDNEIVNNASGKMFN